MRQLDFHKIYETDQVRGLLISSSYYSDYTEQDFNKYLSISFPVKGGFTINSRKNNHMVDTSTIIVERPETAFKVIKSAAFTQDVTLSFQFTGNPPYEVLHHVEDRRALEIFKRTPQVDTLIHRFLNLPAGKGRLAKDQILNELLVDHILDSKLSEPAKSTCDPWISRKMDRAKEFIHSRYSKDISLDDISSACHYSTFHFARVFKQATGFSPYDYLLNVRISEAKRMLCRDHPVGKTAFDVGFNSVSNFSVAFKQIVGRSPSSFKKSKISKNF